MSCDLGIQRVIKEAVKNNPWFKYTEGEKYVYVLDSPNGKINESNYIGAAKKLAIYINKGINNGYKNIGDIAYSVFLNGKGVVEISPSKRQLDLLNAQREEEIAEIQQEVNKENQIKEFEKLNQEANIKVQDGEITPMFQISKKRQLDMFSNTITLKNGAKYDKSDVNSNMLEVIGYTPIEIGKILKTIC